MTAAPAPGAEGFSMLWVCATTEPTSGTRSGRLNVSLIRLLAAGAARLGGAEGKGRALRCMQLPWP